MPNLQTVTDNIKRLDAYLESYLLEQRSTRFEHLVTKSLGHMLRLPFYNFDNDDSSISHRVVWNGSEAKWTRVGGTVDGTVFAYEFCAVVEATLKTGNRQFYDEFTRSLKHYENFLSTTGTKSEDCYLLLIMTELNNETYTAIKQKVTENCRHVLLPISSLVIILETYTLAVTARHADFRLLLEKILSCCKYSSNMINFLQQSTDEIQRWRQGVLLKEKSLFLGAKSYKALRSFGRQAGASEIYGELNCDSVVARYLATMGHELSYDDITKSLECERLAYKAENLPSGEGIYFPLPFPDVKGRIKIFIEELENAGTSS
jgi:hypothetical protein